MKFTDLFVRRPVLALVVSTLILLMGLLAINNLPIRQYPLTESSTLTITATMRGRTACCIVCSVGPSKDSVMLASYAPSTKPIKRVSRNTSSRCLRRSWKWPRRCICGCKRCHRRGQKIASIQSSAVILSQNTDPTQARPERSMGCAAGAKNEVDGVLQRGSEMKLC